MGGLKLSLKKILYFTNLIFVLYCFRWLSNNQCEPRSPTNAELLEVLEKKLDNANANGNGAPLPRSDMAVAVMMDKHYEYDRKENDQNPNMDLGPKMDQSLNVAVPREARGNDDGNVFDDNAQDMPPVEEEEMKLRAPKAVIIGVQKCGTSTLLEFLNLHPDIIRSKVDEAHYFDREYDKVPKDWYLNLFPPHKKHQIAIEKTPFYFYKLPSVPERIKSFNSSMKLIVSLCNPVRRSISSWVQGLVAENINLTKTPERSFENMFGKTSTKGGLTLKKRHDLFKFGMYTDFLHEWYKYFSPKQLHIVDGEAFIKNPLSEIRLIEEFLGIGHKIGDNQLYFDEKKGFFCMKFLTKNGREKSQCMNEKKGRKHPPVEETLVEQMKTLFEPYNKKLESLMGRKLNWT